MLQPPPAQAAARLHVGAAVAAGLDRLATAQGEEPQELPARPADLGQGEVPGPAGAQPEEPSRVPG